MYNCYTASFPQHFLYFLPLPHGHGSFRPARGADRTGCGFGAPLSAVAPWGAAIAGGPLPAEAPAAAALYVLAT